MAGVVEKSNNAAGFANGDALTASGSGGASGNAWDRFIIPGDLGGSGTANTAVIETSPTPPSLPSGNKWMHLEQASNGGQINVYWTKPTARSVWACDFYLQMTSAPTAGFTLFRTFSDAAYGSSAIACNLNVTGSRKVYLGNGKSGESSSGTDSSAALALGTIYYVAWLVDYSAQTATVNIYPVGSTTLHTSATVTFPTANVVQSMRWGIGTANTGAGYRITNIREGYGGFLARPDIVNSGPTITLGAAGRRTYQTGTTVEMPVTAADPDNVSALTLAWQSVPDGVTAPAISDKSGAGLTGIGTTQASRTGQATVTGPGSYVAVASATDSAGVVTTSAYTFEIYPAVDVDTILRSVSKGSFTVVGGPSNDAAGAKTALSDGNPNTALDSITTPTGMSGYAILGPLGPSGMVLYASAKVPDGGTLTRTWKVFKEDGTQLSIGPNGSATIVETVTATTTEVPLVLDNAALSAVPLNSPTDLGRAALRVEWSDTVA